MYETFNPYVLRRIGNAEAVLDVGCATGLLGRELRRGGHTGQLVGIEKDPAMADMARAHYDGLVVSDIESKEDLSLSAPQFDTIVCADVLEHLRDPEAALKRLIPYLHKGGRFVVSVPNVAFVGIRLSLLAGRFTYNASGGIMDATHLRFFTQSTFEQLLKGVGLQVTSLTGYNLVRRRYAFLKALGWLLPSIFCIQFIAEAKKP